jgi:hypothetical protein
MDQAGDAATGAHCHSKVLRYVKVKGIGATSKSKVSN